MRVGVKNRLFRSECVAAADFSSINFQFLSAMRTTWFERRGRWLRGGTGWWTVTARRYRVAYSLTTYVVVVYFEKRRKTCFSLFNHHDTAPLGLLDQSTGKIQPLSVWELSFTQFLVFFFFWGQHRNIVMTGRSNGSNWMTRRRIVNPAGTSRDVGVAFPPHCVWLLSNSPSSSRYDYNGFQSNQIARNRLMFRRDMANVGLLAGRRCHLP